MGGVAARSDWPSGSQYAGNGLGGANPSSRAAACRREVSVRSLCREGVRAFLRARDKALLFHSTCLRDYLDGYPDQYGAALGEWANHTTVALGRDSPLLGGGMLDLLLGRPRLPSHATSHLTYQMYMSRCTYIHPHVKHPTSFLSDSTAARRHHSNQTAACSSPHACICLALHLSSVVMPSPPSPSTAKSLVC